MEVAARRRHDREKDPIFTRAETHSRIPIGLLFPPSAVPRLKGDLQRAATRAPGRIPRPQRKLPGSTAARFG